ncbi:phosphate ABC transporter substrate-binding protein PstS [Mycobacterium kiyosense]
MTVCGAVVTGCGSDDNRGTTGMSGAAAGAGSCGGKNVVTAEGSTAQQNAMGLFNKVWGQRCARASRSPTTGRGLVPGANNSSPATSTSPARTRRWLPPRSGRPASRCGGNPAWDLPLVFGPIALVYNLTGVSKLVLDADAAAKIFSGGIRMWDDPILIALNPGVALPHTRITSIYRKDSSGTTDNFQKYLTAAAPQSWTKGVGTEFQGGVGEGAQRSGGVIQAVQSTPGAIGYVEKGFADRAGVPFAQIDNGNGVVPLSDDTARNAVRSVTFAASGHDLVLELSSIYRIQDPAAYPLVMATYEVVCSRGYDADTAAAVRAFLTTAVDHGQTELPSAGYVPLPDTLKERLVAAINALQ